MVPLECLLGYSGIGRSDCTLEGIETGTSLVSIEHSRRKEQATDHPGGRSAHAGSEMAKLHFRVFGIGGETGSLGA